MKIKLETYKGFIIKEVEDIRVFYNKDCMKYGVQVYGNLWNDNMGNRWEQVVRTMRGKAYTPYKKVADRWLKQLITEE